MKLLGILRASALFILVSAFHGPRGVFCSNLEWDPSNESFTVEVSEDHEDSTVESKVIENPSQEPSTLNLSDGSNNPDGSMATPSSNGAAEDMEAEQEERLKEKLMKEIAEQRTELVERLSKSDAPFSLEDMTLFLGILRDEADVDPEAVQKVGEEIHAYLGSLGIHGEDAKGSLEKLMEKIMEQREYLLDLFSGLIQQRSYEASEASEVDAKDVITLVQTKFYYSDLASAVFFLEEFCQEVRADAFSGRLVEDLYDGLKEPCLRVSYYARSYTDHFRPRNLLDGPYKDALKPEMFKDYIEWLKKNIPGITGSLEHLSNEFKGLSEKILKNDASVAPTIYGFEFHDAWTDKDFMSSLRHKTSNLVNALKSLHGSLGKIHSDSFRNPLTEAQSNLVFKSSTWDDSMLASTFVFIKQFCEDVHGENFGGKVTNRVLYRGIKAVCRGCMVRLNFLSRYFIPKYGPGSVAERKEIDMDFYEGILEPKDFDVYVKWLVKNIPGIIESLKNMHDEAVKLTEEQLKTDTSTGPLKYGFVYVYKGSWWSRPCYKNSLDAISQYCLAVMRSLAPMKHLLGCLDKNYGICPQESSSELSAPSSQSYLVFQSSTWDDSHLASAFLFIEEFCSLVNAENFGGNLKVLNDVKDNKDAQWLSGKVKSLCSSFSSYLESLSTNLVPSGVTVNPYEGVLKSDKFNTYAEWLVKNIPGIRESVQKMFNESKKLNKAQLKTETSMGPSKYGFEFVGDKWKPFVHYNLKDLTWCLRATLEYLQKYLDKILKDPQCENASITSKVFSLFSREKKSDVNSQQENSTVKSQAA
ncbi:secreted antigen 1 [Babesia divergens]|uniref:Secreted antigen 1 n=1 Tax=Babesia divergens TaxID=32595 RepID=A0AAD9GH70_BABDI|nr:secreted antigen 1 [Babesia divergens]